ncbi:phage protein [Aquitalea magnusonii]|uniref:Phage protein n=1 Tax=Aquitalea magnusonii TaxID=332411 RepID=A0A3G9GC80_9NEIS|nr:hypothetical protein [Aquitalea magnusonii]BBF84413.1 phage protein [Aquitalea magnusonii]
MTETRRKVPGRRPAHLEMAGGKPKRQRIWEAIRTLKEFNLINCAHKADVDMDTTKTYLQTLERAGFIEDVSGKRGGHDEKRWQLARDIGMEAPRLTKEGKPVTQGMGTTNMWRVMRLTKGDFDYLEIARSASTPEHQVKPETARSYLKALHSAGYLDMVVAPQTKPAMKGGKTPARWRLLPYNRINSKKPGPRAPMIQRLKRVFDPNWAEVVFQEEADDE